MPTINPVCYNGLNKPTRDAVNFGTVSLGTINKDYTTLLDNNWRAGINPSTNTVIYTDTNSRGVDTPAAAIPSIHWISGQSQANIIELISRLPERAPNNYEIFASYDEAIDWLLSTTTYMLVNTKYPEYLLDAECAVNIELGFLASYPGTGTQVYDLVSGSLSNNRFTAAGGAFTAPAAGSFVGYFRSLAGGKLTVNPLKDASGDTFDQSLVVEGVFYQDGSVAGNFLIGDGTDDITVIVNGAGNLDVKSGGFIWSWTGVSALTSTGIFHIAAYIPTGTGTTTAITVFINGTQLDSAGPSGYVLSGTGPLANATIGRINLCEGGSPTHATTTRVYGFKVYGYNDESTAMGSVAQLGPVNYAAISAVYGI
jgi:hypothetical protein